VLVAIRILRDFSLTPREAQQSETGRAKPSPKIDGPAGRMVQFLDVNSHVLSKRRIDVHTVLGEEEHASPVGGHISSPEFLRVGCVDVLAPRQHVGNEVASHPNDGDRCAQ